MRVCVRGEVNGSVSDIYCDLTLIKPMSSTMQPFVSFSLTLSLFLPMIILQ